MNPVEQVFVRRGTDPLKDINVPATMRVLREVPRVLTPIDVFLRDEYDNALSTIKQSRRNNLSFVVIGHPGIGV